MQKTTTTTRCEGVYFILFDANTTRPQPPIDMDLDDPVPSAPVASASTVAAAATLLDLFAVASSPPGPLAPALPHVPVNGVQPDDNTESEGEPASDEPEDPEDELVLDAAVEERRRELAAATTEPKAPPKRGSRRRPAATTPAPAEDAPVSPISQDVDDVEGASREVSPVSERSVDADEEGAEDDGDEGDDAEPDGEDGGEKSEGEPDPEDAADKSEEDADLEADKSDADDPKSDIEEDPKSDVDVDKSDEEMDADADVEMEVQPAHRAEALDVLAAIELKYALLREAVYLERMEGLGWEEALVVNGTHPELLHIQRELAARRDRRIELATRKRSFEHADAERKRRVGEGGVWAWWKVPSFFLAWFSCPLINSFLCSWPATNCRRI
jgi:hypothetical protein